VHVRTWQAAYEHVFPPERLAELSVERRAAQWRESPPLVAEIGGTVVGFVSVGASRDADASGELFAIYVEPDHWGTGVGGDLLAAGEQRLRELGHTDAILWVLEDNPRARRFYERAGCPATAHVARSLSSVSKSPRSGTESSSAHPRDDFSLRRESYCRYEADW
jgi:GNAT superfamily N-acetyltransferase